MRESLVSINLTYGNELLNPSPVPILFYWNGKEDESIDSQIAQAQEFANLVEEKCFNSKMYVSSLVTYFFFKYEKNEEVYEESSFNIQDAYLLENMDEDKSLFYYDYLKKYFNKLYEKVFKENYDWEIWSSTDDALKDMFNQIQQKHPERFSLETLSNYIRLQLQKNEGLNNKNIDFVLDKLTNILTTFSL